MAIPDPFPIRWPDLLPPSASQRSVEPVGGTFAVTATLPTIGDIIDWKEGECAFDYGYYRFIDHPDLRQIQEGLKAHFGVRHGLVYCSLPSAVMELLDYLLLARPGITLKVVSDGAVQDLFPFEDALAGLGVPVTVTAPDRLETLVPLSASRDEIVVLAVSEPSAFLEANDTWFEAVYARRLPTVVVMDRIPEKPIALLPRMYVAVPLHHGDAPVTGAAILSNADRQMNEVRERRKQRGPILSSRNAAYFLGRVPVPDVSYDQAILDKLCRLEQAHRGFLFPSGMQAIMTLLTQLRRPGKAQVIAVGHLYTDTYTLLSYARHRIGDVENLFIGVDELDQLPGAITDQTACILTETITNPLNDVPDIPFIVEEAHKRRVPVIVDNTFATPLHCTPLSLGVDYVVHSTTKYFSGRNDHAGGVVLMKENPMADAVAQHQQHWGNTMSPLESEVLWERLQDLEERMHRFQANADRVAAFLEAHPAVERVYYSGLPSHRCHDVARRILRGCGSVVSFVLSRPGLEGLRAFYDAPLAPIVKAPSLGSNRTMVCPYTLLAHYHEPDEVLEEWGLPRYLVRLAIGCEPDIQPVLDALGRGLDEVTSE